MADKNRPGETGKTGPGHDGKPEIREDDLERRRRLLAETLAARRQDEGDGGEGTKSGGMTGYGQALKLSSEFVAGVGVGAVIGWLVDRLAGITPWGLIIFLLLGFGAGVLNVLRAAGTISEAGLRHPEKDAKNRDN